MVTVSADKPASYSMIWTTNSIDFSHLRVSQKWSIARGVWSVRLIFVVSNSGYSKGYLGDQQAVIVETKIVSPSLSTAAFIHVPIALRSVIQKVSVIFYNKRASFLLALFHWKAWHCKQTFEWNNNVKMHVEETCDYAAKQVFTSLPLLT